MNGKEYFTNADSFLHSASSEYIQGTNRLEYTNYAEEFNLIPIRIKRPASTDAEADSFKNPIFWFRVTPSLVKVINDKGVTDQATVLVNVQA